MSTDEKRARRRLIASLVLVALLAVSCDGSDDGSPEATTPDGWQPVELDGLEFAVPGGFGRADDADPRAEAVFQLDTGDPATSAGIAVFRSSPTTTAGDTTLVSMYVANLIVSGLSVEGYENDPPVEEDVPGAIEAESLRWRYEEPSAEEPLVSDGLFLRTDNAILEVRYVRAGERDDELVEQLFGSVRAIE